jgi:amino acid transporter
MLMRLLDLLLGRKLANYEGEERKIGAFEGVPALGLDGLASSAYGPEAALVILGAAGAAGIGQIGPVMLAILVLLAMLTLSYWQTIAAYPTSGGSYTVARENLGANAGLVAATALMIDYVLNVAVGISAGVGALTSAVPELHPYTLELCLAILALITLINLRGTLEAGLVFSVPTYLFIASFAALLLFGLAKALASGGNPVPVVPPPAMPGATEAVTLWLLLRAFASGCTAMTGVEAVSNGVGAFRAPSATHAHRTLAGIVVVLAALLAGIAYLAGAYSIAPMDQSDPGYQSVLSQLAAAVVGRGTLYFVAIGSLLAVLCLSANTSFAGFPRLCRQVAQDGYLPRGFALPGRRLVYSAGILWLALTAGGLLTLFGGITDRLIPLFAVGAFLSFTLSQAGMAVHWRRQLGHEEEGRHGNCARLAVNAAGALATGISLAVILAAKFVEGAWITVLTIPCVLTLLLLIKRYYAQIERQLIEEGPIDVDGLTPPIVVVPIAEWNRLAERAICYALRLSPEVIGVHMTRLEGPDEEEHAGKLRRRWRDDVERPARVAGRHPPRLVQLPSPYRSITGPLLKFILQTRETNPHRAVAVVIPTLVQAHWWDRLLHTGRVRRIRATLLRHGGPDLAVVTVPWTLEEPRPEAVIAEEEPRHQRPALQREVEPVK